MALTTLPLLAARLRKEYSYTSTYLNKDSFTFCDFYKACFIPKTIKTKSRIVILVVISVFCYVKPCSLVHGYQRSGGTSFLHLRSIWSRWFARYAGTVPGTKSNDHSRPVYVQRAPNPDNCTRTASVYFSHWRCHRLSPRRSSLSLPATIWT